MAKKGRPKKEKKEETLEDALGIAQDEIKNPLAIPEDDISWLELGDIEGVVPNSIYKYNWDDPLEALTKVFSDPDNLGFTCKHLLGIELFPFQLAILDVLWHKRQPLLIASRGGSKTFMLGLYSLLRMILNPGCKVVIVSAGFRQAKQVMEGMIDIWHNSSILQDLCIGDKRQGPKQEVDRLQFIIGKSTAVACPLGTGEKIRGLRANYIIADEMASINEEIFNIVVQGFGIVSGDVKDKVKEAALIKKLKREGVWTKEMDELRKSSFQGNQIIRAGTGFFSFNHFAKTKDKWKAIIDSKGDQAIVRDLLGDDGAIEEGFNYKDFAIIQVPYNKVPESFLDPAMLAQAKMTLTHAQFLCEYGAVFPKDSDGFFKRSILESCTTVKPILTSSGRPVQFAATREGNDNNVYAIGLDPARSEDNAAIVVIELHKDHRRVVYCWSVNRKKFSKLRSMNLAEEDDYYVFLARKVRDLMKVFRIKKIVMDSQGGGASIVEVLGDPKNCQEGEQPIYEIIDPEDPKNTDMKEGVHILHMIKPTNEFNAISNHEMLKDFETRALLFPAFDMVELARMSELDNMREISIDTYEDLVDEIEELKNEITSIVCTTTDLGKEKFGTPAIKGENQKKGKLKKDRYSALLYVNKSCRDDERADSPILEYKAVGSSSKKDHPSDSKIKPQKGSGYIMLKPNKLQGHAWLQNPYFGSCKHISR